jgi:hypothetical protein
MLAAALGLFTWALAQSENNGDIKKMIPALCASLFVACMFCHGELARRRPAPRHLTLFYLMVSVGGALGGIFVALIAPRVFHSYWELPLGLIACGVLAMIAIGKDQNTSDDRASKQTAGTPSHSASCR